MEKLSIYLLEESWSRRNYKNIGLQSQMDLWLTWENPKYFIIYSLSNIEIGYISSRYKFLLFWVIII